MVKMVSCLKKKTHNISHWGLLCPISISQIVIDTPLQGWAADWAFQKDVGSVDWAAVMTNLVAVETFLSLHWFGPTNSI